MAFTNLNLLDTNKESSLDSNIDKYRPWDIYYRILSLWNWIRGRDRSTAQIRPSPERWGRAARPYTRVAREDSGPNTGTVGISVFLEETNRPGRLRTQKGLGSEIIYSEFIQAPSLLPSLIVFLDS